MRDYLSEIILQWYFGKGEECLPLTSENYFLAKSAVDLAASIKNREITASQLIKETISRMNRINGVLNAIVDGPFPEALEQAKDIDNRIANNQISECM